MGDRKHPEAGGKVQSDNNASSGGNNQSGLNPPDGHMEGGGPHGKDAAREEAVGKLANAEKQFGKGGVDTNDGGENDRDPVEGARNDYGTGNEQMGHDAQGPEKQTGGVQDRGND
jgi:hypothetical protein